jgi:hypothetical protein
VAIIVTTWFTSVNMVMLPIGYVSHLLSLIRTITNSDETMDEFDEKLDRVKTIMKFIVVGPFYILWSLPLDTYVFWKNLKTKDYDPDAIGIRLVLDKETFTIFNKQLDATLL